MKTLGQITSTLDSNKAKLFSKYAIRSLAIFGSYARNQQTPNSDLDSLVDFNEKEGVGFIDLADEIEELLETKVDLVSKNAVKEKYFQQIKSDLIYV